MASDLFSHTNVNTMIDVLTKLGVGAVLGGIVGWERELSGRPAGIRTHMLVVLGVILFSEVSKAFTPSDQDRIAAQIVTGIGFLGAGTILRNGAEVHGLTSAASIWAVSGIAMAISVGGAFYVIAAAATVLTLITLNVIERIENSIAPGLKPHELLVTLEQRENMVTLIEGVTTLGGRLFGVRVINGGPPVQVELTVQGSREDLMRLAVATPGVTDASWKR